MLSLVEFVQVKDHTILYIVLTKDDPSRPHVWICTKCEKGFCFGQLRFNLRFIIVIVLLRCLVGGRRHEETLCPDVLHYPVVQQVFDTVATGNQTPGHRGADLVRDPVRDQSDVASVLGQLVRVEYKLFRIGATARNHNDAVLAKDGFQLELVIQVLIICHTSRPLSTHIIRVPQIGHTERLKNVGSTEQLQLDRARGQLVVQCMWKPLRELQVSRVVS